jgi:hypothetical protein
MKKNRTKYYFTAILLIHIFVYFFKIDKDIFAFQEYVNRPNQTYTEQPHSNNVSYFGRSSSECYQFSKLLEAKNNSPDGTVIWNAILLSYNSRVHHLLKLNESYFAQTIRIITVLYRLNFFHKSSEDEELEYRFLA